MTLTYPAKGKCVKTKWSGLCAFFAPRRADLLYSPGAAEMDIGPIDITRLF